jgi:chromosome segregation ATPase
MRDSVDQYFDERERSRALRELEDLSDERFDLDQELNRIHRRLEDIEHEEKDWKQHFLAHGGRENDLY